MRVLNMINLKALVKTFTPQNKGEWFITTILSLILAVIISIILYPWLALVYAGIAFGALIYFEVLKPMCQGIYSFFYGRYNYYKMQLTKNQEKDIK